MKRHFQHLSLSYDACHCNSGTNEIQDKRASAKAGSVLIEPTAQEPFQILHPVHTNPESTKDRTNY